MILFALFALLIVGGASVYVGLRLTAPLPGAWRALVWALLAAQVLITPMAFVLIRSPSDAAWHGPVQWVAYLGMGLFSLLFAFTLAADITRALASLLDVGVRLGGGGALLDPGRRRLLFGALDIGVVGLSGLVLGAGFRGARTRAKVERVDIPIEDLPPALDGLTIAQVSDIHVGPTIGAERLAQIVAQVNALDADIIAVTGDLVDGRLSVLRDEVAPLAGLSARHGAFFVTGNHEYYSGVFEWLGEVERLGLTPLVNAHRVIEHQGARLLLAGITDHRAGSLVPAHAPEPAAAVAGAPSCDARVLLAHQPRSAFMAADVGFDLMLAGHTHGGQYFPWTLLVRAVEPFAVGLHKLGRMWIYTNRGTGYWGPPLRLGSTAEITLLTLRGAP